MRDGRKREKDKLCGGIVKILMEIVTAEYCKKFYPVRDRNSHKGTYGSANIIAGSDKYPGALVLALQTALKSGCGYVKLTTSSDIKYSLALKFPQTVFIDEPDLSSDCIVMGMGCGVSEGLYSQLKYLLENYRKTLIIDADGLNSIAVYGKEVLNNKKCKVIMTPHVKEFSRLTGISVDEITANPEKLARNFANEYNIILLLKGADSIITDGERILVNTEGTTALAKAGSGDMLSGYMCGTVARGVDPFGAVCCACYTLGLSAEISSEQKTDYCADANDIINNLHNAVRRLTAL